MKHPYQNIVATASHLFASVKNHLQVFDIETGSLVGSWEDTVDSQEHLKKEHQAKFELALEEEPATKRAESNEKSKIPKFPTPGPGAPTIYNYIRSLELTKSGKYLIGVTDSDKSIIIFLIDYNNSNCLTLVKRQTFPKRPCSISVADNEQTAIIGDKFGDVYKLGIDNEPAVPEKSLKPILGHVSMLTDVLVGEVDGKQYVLTGDRDEHIKVSHYPQTHIVKHWLFGHDEFISSMIFPEFDNKLLLSAGGDDSVFLWNWIENRKLSSFDLRPHIESFLTDSHLPPERFMTETSIREISVVRLLNYGRKVFVLIENTKCLVSLNIEHDLKLTLNKIVQLESPLVDIDLAGDKIVAASDSEKLIQFFDQSLEEVSCPISPDSNPCEVASREQVYPLYTMNSLRKRSEH